MKLNPHNIIRKNPSDGRSSNLDETRTNIDKNSAIQKEIFESKAITLFTSIEYEIALIKADQVVYNSQKTAMLTFEILSEQKAKNRLLLVHS